MCRRCKMRNQVGEQGDNKDIRPDRLKQLMHKLLYTREKEAYAMSSIFNGCFDDDFVLILVLFILLVIVGASWD